MAYATVYGSSDLGNLGIDIAGSLMKGIVDNMPLIIIVSIVMVLVVTLIGIVPKLLHSFKFRA